MLLNADVDEHAATFSHFRSRVYLLPGKVRSKIRRCTLTNRIRNIKQLNADGRESQMLTRRELTRVAVWAPLPSSQRSCYSVVPPMAVILSISPGVLFLERLRAMPEWQWHKHSIIITLSHLFSMGTRCCLFKSAWIWELVTASFFIALFHSFFGFLSSTNLCFAPLSSLYRGRNCCVTAADSQ